MKVFQKRIASIKIAALSEVLLQAVYALKPSP